MNVSRRFDVIFLLACSLACCASGVYLIAREHDGPAIGVTAAGELLYSQSSGSGDCWFLGAGLLNFMFTAAVALAARASPSARTRLIRVYFINLVVFLSMLWLVILDSNLVEAARVGDVMPLLSLLPAFAPAVLLPPIWIFGRFSPDKRA